MLRLYVVKQGLSELHSVLVFGMLIQGGFRAELGTALCACELSRRGGPYGRCFRHYT